MADKTSAKLGSGSEGPDASLRLTRTQILGLRRRIRDLASDLVSLEADLLKIQRAMDGEPSRGRSRSDGWEGEGR